jgi:hypothetical protein
MWLLGLIVVAAVTVLASLPGRVPPDRQSSAAKVRESPAANAADEIPRAESSPHPHQSPTSLTSP